MFRLAVYTGAQVALTFAGTLQSIRPCDVCGDDLDLHERLLVQFDLAPAGSSGSAPGTKVDVAVNDYRVVGCDRQPRVWRMWAKRQDSPLPGRDFMYFGDEHGVKRPWTGRGTPTKVVLTEDSEGSYWGWIRCDPKTGHSGTPIMIQPNEAMFRIQEPGGFHGRVEEGRGEVVRLAVRVAD